MLKSLTPSRLILLFSGTVAVLALMGIWKIPQHQVEPIQNQIKALKKLPDADPKEIATLEKSKLDAENAARTVLVQGAGGLFAAAAAYIAWRNLKATQEKQVAERFSKAVEQLGNDNIHVRLGGIYALEQIAKDAEEKYYWQVMETLTSYIRVASPITEETKLVENDIQEAVRVLARRKYTYGHPLEPDRLNLCKTNLHGLQLFPNSKLQGMDLTETNLQNAKLSQVNLQEAKLDDAKMQRVLLLEANMDKAQLKGAKLRDAKLFKTILSSAHLAAAELQNAYLEEANLKKAVLIKAELGKANLKKANLEEANLWGANMLGAQLNKANLKRTRFKENHPNLGKMLGKQAAINLTWEQIKQAKAYTKELLPDYLLKELAESEAQECAASTQKSAESSRDEGESAPHQED